MEMQRRDLFKLMGLGLSGLGLSRFASPAFAQQSPRPAQSVPGALRFEREKGRAGPFGWPLDEVRIPFRERKGKVKFPNNAKLAVRVYITTEWDSGATNYDSLQEPDHKAVGTNLAWDRANLYQLSFSGQYTFTVGVYRAMEMTDKYGIVGSVAADGGAVAAFPDLHGELHKKGWEIMARNWDHHYSPWTYKPGDEQVAELKRVNDAIKQVTGANAYGWLSAGGNGSASWMKLLADSGFLYTTDLMGDDIPYGLKFGDKMLVAIPHRQYSCNDFHNFLRTGGISARTVNMAYDYFCETFTHFYETVENQGWPVTMLYGIHPYWSCWPDRIKFHDKAMAFMKGFKDVWFVRHNDLAKYWKDTYLS